MSGSQLYDVWWTEPESGEQRMEDGHQVHWRKVLQYVEEQDLSEDTILDFGCNQGGFLRFLHGERPFRSGIGIDLARRSVEIANKRKGNLPIHYEATSTPEQYRHRFDLAISISVIYLISDLREHAWKIKQALKPGGVYYATYSDYAGNPSLPSIREKINRHGSLPMNEHTLDDIAGAFLDEGFQVGIRRMLPQGYVAVSGEERWFNCVSDRMLFEYEQMYIFRFTAPAEA
ncbi:methyltransferase domain-containing protein [Cohnella sp. CFH 77786]|uniref:class I SAM-dependent methyltransferase n=1 Tax=Cohnella sp. CFH 77786 TaxID=2662265 RepID=UPI001C60955C|nr:class I SAM-dependent methyltransferase [Cohnella sp. CFH 77786]MBW5446104.1 methyltransferase domain-containing protein [Cohnella sp. CFH 77786]